MTDSAQSTDGTERCPVCGSKTGTTRGFTIENGERIEWDYCGDNCGWEGPSRSIETDTDNSE